MHHNFEARVDGGGNGLVNRLHHDARIHFERFPVKSA
jgi:hypothetical protein